MRNVRIEVTPQKNSYGEYIKHLTIDNVIWMTNDDIEYKDIHRAIKNARGDCLVGGLGMGVVIEELLLNPDVTSITVVEILPEVIRLVETDLLLKANKNNRPLNIIQGDCLKNFGEKTHYDFIYGDWWLEPDDEIKTQFKEWQDTLFKYNLINENTIIDCWLKERVDSA